MCFFGFNGLAHAALINFDDLATSPNTGTGNYGFVPSSYQGFTWTGWEVTDNASYNSAYHNNVTFPSAPNAAYNGGNGNGTVTISNSTPFNFSSAYFSTWTSYGAPSYGATTLTVTAYLGAVQEGSVTFNLANVLTLETFNFSNINNVTFTADAGGGGAYWLMDNAQVSAVPLPPSVLLLAPGLLALVGLRRRFKL